MKGMLTRKPQSRHAKSCTECTYPKTWAVSSWRLQTSAQDIVPAVQSHASAERCKTLTVSSFALGCHLQAQRSQQMHSTIGKASQGRGLLMPPTALIAVCSRAGGGALARRSRHGNCTCMTLLGAKTGMLNMRSRAVGMSVQLRAYTAAAVRLTS